MSYGADRAGPLGHLRIGLQRARSRSDVSVLELRRPGPRSRAGTRRGSRRRALRDRAGGDGGPAGRRAQLRRAWSTAGARGPYGFYEALDYTRSRLPEGEPVAIVRAYMAHHQGMTLVALVNVLRDGLMRERFHARAHRPGHGSAVAGARPAGRGGRAPSRGRGGGAGPRARVRGARLPPIHVPARSDAADAPALQWAIRGDADGGRLRLQPLRRPGHHPVARGHHARCLGHVHLPARRPERGGLVGRVPAHRRRAGRLPRDVLRRPRGDPATRRRHHDHARGAGVARGRRRDAPGVAHEPRDADPGDRGDVVRRDRAGAAARRTPRIRPSPICSSRRTRSPSSGPPGHAPDRSAPEPSVWAAHIVAVEGQAGGGPQYETDRGRFLGRGRGIRTPMAVIDGRPLSNTAGSVLDPIFSLRRRVRLGPGESVPVVFSTLVAPSREAAIALAEKYRDPASFERTATLAWTQAQVQLHHLGIGADEAHLFQELASRILYSDPTLRAARGRADAQRGGDPRPSGATRSPATFPSSWCGSTSPRIAGIVRQLLRAHEYWRMKGLAVDLVILNEKAQSYTQELQSSLEALVRASQSASWHERHERHGYVFILRKDLLSSAGPRLPAGGRPGRLAESTGDARRAAGAAPGCSGRGPPRAAAPRRGDGLVDDAPPSAARARVLQWPGGLRRRTDASTSRSWGRGNGRRLPGSTSSRIPASASRCRSPAPDTRGRRTAARTSSPRGRTIRSVTRRGRRSTCGTRKPEALWGPTVLPIREEAWPYVAQHGQGYSRFEHTAHGIALDLLQFVPLEDPVKISRLDHREPIGPRPTAVGDRVRRVGAGRVAQRRRPVRRDGDRRSDTGALLARNAWNVDFGDRVAFADLGGRQTAWTGRPDRVPRPQRDARPSGALRSAGSGSRAGSAPGSIPAPRSRRWSSCRRAVAWRSSFCSARRRAAEEARALVDRYRAIGPRSRAPSGDDAAGMTSSARSRSRRRTGRWTSC